MIRSYFSPQTLSWLIITDKLQITWGHHRTGLSMKIANGGPKRLNKILNMNRKISRGTRNRAFWILSTKWEVSQELQLLFVNQYIQNFVKTYFVFTKIFFETVYMHLFSWTLCPSSLFERLIRPCRSIGQPELLFENGPWLSLGLILGMPTATSLVRCWPQQITSFFC